VSAAGHRELDAQGRVGVEGSGGKNDSRFTAVRVVEVAVKVMAVRPAACAGAAVATAPPANAATAATVTTYRGSLVATWQPV
jgi:hypothetical protein